jgi:hypothetical protein
MRAQRHEDIQDSGGTTPPLLTSALDADVVSFTSATHSMGGWVGPRAGLEVMEKRANRTPTPRSSTPEHSSSFYYRCKYLTESYETIGEPRFRNETVDVFVVCESALFQSLV